MVDMNVNIAGVSLKNPVIAASGTIGFADTFDLYMDVNKLGGVALKALTAEERQGNDPPRIAETPSGVLNSVGLQNPGADVFLQKIYPRLKRHNTVKIANIAGSSPEEYLTVIEKLNDTDLELYELNVSCPNVTHGGMQFGTDASVLEELVKKAKKASKKPLIVKLTPNVTDITVLARAAVNGGADALSLINTITGMAINPRTKRPILQHVTGGLSGPAIKPIALRMVWEVYRAKVGVPIIGMGGITTGEDAAEFMMAGADAVMAGTATLSDPSATLRIAEELEQFAESFGIEKITELTGTLITDN